MATQEYAASIQGVSIRVTRLDSTGTLLSGPGDSYTTSAFMRISFTPEYEEGDEITEKGANGVVCVTYKAPDTLKRITMELAICEPDPELTALLSGGLLLRKDVGQGDVKSVGWAAPGVGDDPAGNGVAIEAWSHAVKDGKRSGVLPYFHWVFPYAKMRQSGDRVIENGLMANTFEGFGLGNVNFQAGPDGRWEFPLAAERPYAYARTSWAPTAINGFYQWSDNATNTVYFTSTTAKDKSAVTLTSAAATYASEIGTGVLTFSAAHNLAVGDVIQVQNVSSLLNGSRTVTAISSSSPYTASFVADNEEAISSFTVPTAARVTAVKSATQSPTATQVTSAALGSGDGAPNVPGSISYDPELAIDNILSSNEDA
jgi:hypothetical protein